MKIHAFKVIQVGDISLDSVFGRINALPLQDRLTMVVDVPLRLEEARKVGDTWYADFAAIKHDGPGKASATTPIEDFDLEDTEGFGHETAAMFDMSSGFMTLQYNHYGPRSSRIQNYLHLFAKTMAAEAGADTPDSHGFVFEPVLKADAAERLNYMGIVKNIDISFFVPGVLAQQNDKRESLNSFLTNPLVGSADRIRIQLSASRARSASLAVNHVKRMVTDLLGVKDDVSELSISARETEESPREPVDFIQARLEADIPIDRTGRRYGRNERLEALRQAFNTWARNNQFK